MLKPYCGETVLGRTVRIKLVRMIFAVRCGKIFPGEREHFVFVSVN